MSWRKCVVSGCDMRIREGLVRGGEGRDGQELADGRTCWRCRRKQTTAEARRRARDRAARKRGGGAW